MDLKKIPYYKQNWIFFDWKDEIVPIIPVPEHQEDCYTFEEHKAYKTMWDIMRGKVPIEIKNPHLVNTKDTEKSNMLKSMRNER
jgi:hypothetical protein